MSLLRNKSIDPYACLRPPELHGWPYLQARLVDRAKRVALRQLHSSTQGEILLLQMYLVGEEAAELTLHDEVMSKKQPDWLTKQVTLHVTDERKHVSAFTEAIVQRGITPRQSQPDWLSRRKLVQWKRLAQRYAMHFSQGTLVPAYAIGLCAEQMTVRVLSRHCDAINTSHKLHGLLAGVLTDEHKHVQFCSYTLRRIVAQDELPYLRTLLVKIRKIERGFGVSGAIAMYFAGLLCSLRHGIGKLARR